MTDSAAFTWRRLWGVEASPYEGWWWPVAWWGYAHGDREGRRHQTHCTRNSLGHWQLEDTNINTESSYTFFTFNIPTIQMFVNYDTLTGEDLSTGMNMFYFVLVKGLFCICSLFAYMCTEQGSGLCCLVSMTTKTLLENKVTDKCILTTEMMKLYNRYTPLIDRPSSLPARASWWPAGYTSHSGCWVLL